jgi:UDP-N-acetyl-D-galactosamine dehydrogenase
MDPWVDSNEAMLEYAISPVKTPEQGTYDGIVIPVAHKECSEMGGEVVRRFGKPLCVVYEVKGLFSPNESDIRL